MKIFFKRTGGLAAMSLSVTIDTKKLPEEDSRRLHNLINLASFFDQPESLLSAAPGADRFHYEIKVDAKGRVKIIDIDESAVPALLRPLIDHLIGLARVKKK